MNIYEKVAEEVEKHPGKDAFLVFVIGERLGIEETRRVRDLKKKNAADAARFPQYENYVWVKYKKDIESAAGTEAEMPPAEVDADVAIPCFALAKMKKANPADVVREMKESIDRAKLPFVAAVEASGGYVNVRFDMERVAQETIRDAQKKTYGASCEGTGKTVVVEYSSPNTAKPMSVGHLRSTVIGESLKRLYEFQGYTVVGINHLGDFGTQFGKLLVAYERWQDKAAFAKRPMQEMLRLYVKFHDEAEKDPTLENEAREAFKKLENGDTHLAKLWLLFCAVSVKEFERVYGMLGVQIDLALGESFYRRKLTGVVERCLANKVAVKNEDGSVAVFPDGLPSFLLQKKDGSSLYATRDIAAAEFRQKELNPEKIIYVVGGEQTLHFQQVFATLARLGYDGSRFEHDGFGLVSLPEGKMSTREGRIVFLEDLLAEAKRRAYTIVSQKSPHFAESERTHIAEAVGVGAIIYSDLAQSREKDIVFSWEKALTMEGNSAPYLMYAYARAMSILRKSNEEPNEKDIEVAHISTERERRLVRHIARFPEVVRDATATDHPHLVATYLNTLVQDFNRFYAEDPVLAAEGTVRMTRLLIVGAVARVLENGLSLLGITPIERM